MKSQNQMILDHLMEHGHINQLEALGNLGIMRLASRINDLRSAGHPIITEMITVTNRRQETCRVAEYRLIKRAAA